jgi:hypothetical protein
MQLKGSNSAYFDVWFENLTVSGAPGRWCSSIGTNVLFDPVRPASWARAAAAADISGGSILCSKLAFVGAAVLLFRLDLQLQPVVNDRWLLQVRRLLDCCWVRCGEGGGMAHPAPTLLQTFGEKPSVRSVRIWWSYFGVGWG